MVQVAKKGKIIRNIVIATTEDKEVIYEIKRNDSNNRGSKK